MEKDHLSSFVEESGFKLLSLSNLNGIEYSLVLYLLHCRAANLNSLVMNEIELATLLGNTVAETKDALSHLVASKVIDLQYGDLTQKPKNQSFRISLSLKPSEWKLDRKKSLGTEDNLETLVFPFRTNQNFKLLSGDKGTTRHKSSKHKASSKTSASKATDWKLIVDAFAKGRKLSASQIYQSEKSAQALLATYPCEQIILLIKHFGQRIPALNLLLSSWHHYASLHDEETTTVDLQGARQKHQEMDQKIRDFASDLLKRAKDLKLNEEEITVLEILSQHRHPRRQLFWAYQMRHNYPELKELFEKAPEWMLPVTNGGQFVRMPE